MLVEAVHYAFSTVISAPFLWNAEKKGIFASKCPCQPREI